MKRDIVDAACRQDLEELERCLAEGLDIDTCDRDQRTLLMNAITALALSSSDAGEQIIAFLIDRGANVNARDRGQWTALHAAAQDQRLAIVKLLLHAGAEVDAVDGFGNTPLWRCVMDPRTDHDVVKCLLAAGADPNKKNNYGISALDHARQIADEALTRLLSGEASA